MRGDLGRTVQEIGTRLTPAHLMEQAKRSLKESTVETTKAVAQSATDVASDVASRTRDVALDARDQVQAHPYAVGAVGAGIGLGYWLVASAMRGASVSCRVSGTSHSIGRAAGRTPSRRAMWTESRASRLIPLGAAAAAAWLIWRSRD